MRSGRGGDMLRELTKTGVANGIYWTGIDRLIGVRSGVNEMPLIISYHRVVENYRDSASRSIPPMLISARTFEKHLDWIGRNYEFASLDEIGRHLEGKRAGRKPLAAITFDDGYSDVYWNGLPILARKGIPSAVFVVTDLVGTAQLHVHDELYLLLSGILKRWSSLRLEMRKRMQALGIYTPSSKKLLHYLNDPFKATRVCLESMDREHISTLLGILREHVELPDDKLYEFHSLSWEMLSEMSRQGVTVGSHTKSHVLLANEAWDRQLDEIKGSREVLERNLGVGIRHFAYPDGCFDTSAVRGVAAAGFRHAYTTCLHRYSPQPMLTIPRRVLWENSSLDSFGRFSPAILSCQINGIFDPASKCQQEHWESPEA